MQRTNRWWITGTFPVSGHVEILQARDPATGTDNPRVTYMPEGLHHPGCEARPPIQNSEMDAIRAFQVAGTRWS